MRRFYAPFSLSLFAAGVLLVAGCGGPPADNPMLEKARTAYEAAANDSLILVEAPVELKEAEEDLEHSEELWREKEDKALIDHYAYLASQRVKIAHETAKLHAAEQAVKRAEVERKEVVAEARAREADRARAEAEESRREAAENLRAAEQARQEAQEAMQRAEELAARVNELEADQTARGLVLTLGDVLFDVDAATLKAGGERAVGELTNFLNDYPKRTVLIEGFTDSTGPTAYNEKLSQRRADAVHTALTGNGIAASRIRTRGYGEAYPVASNDTQAGRQQNRRVEVIISDKTGEIPARSEE